MKNMNLLSECRKNPTRFKLLKIYKKSMLKFQLLNFMGFVKALKFNLPAILNSTLTLFLTALIGSSKESKKIKICSLTSNNILKLLLKLSRKLKIPNKKPSFQPYLLSLLRNKASSISSEKQNLEMTPFQSSNFSKPHNKMSKILFSIVMI